MVGVAQDVQGAARVLPVVAASGITYPVLIDPDSRLAAAFGFQITPAGVFLSEDGAVRYIHGSAEHQFDVADPRIRANLERHLSGLAPVILAQETRFRTGALEVFARGAELYATGDTPAAVRAWRAALDLDPDNFLIRSQIWAAEHPERFWPAVDREWQQARLELEGYDKPLP